MVFEKGTIVMIENVYYVLILSLVDYNWSFSCGCLVNKFFSDLVFLLTLSILVCSPKDSIISDYNFQLI